MGTFQSKHKYDVATGEMTIKGRGRNDRKREHVTRIAQHHEVPNKINTQPFDKDQNGNGVHSNEQTISDKQGDITTCDYKEFFKESHDEPMVQSTTTESKTGLLHAQKDSVNYELQHDNVLTNDDDDAFMAKNKAVELRDENGHANFVPKAEHKIEEPKSNATGDFVPEAEHKIEEEPKSNATEARVLEETECETVEVSGPEHMIEPVPKSNATNPDDQEETKLVNNVNYQTAELNELVLNNDGIKEHVNSHEVTQTFKVNEDYFVNQVFIEEEKKATFGELAKDKVTTETIEPSFSSSCEQEAITVLNEVIKEAVTKAADELEEPVCIINTTRSENGDADIYTVTAQTPNGAIIDEMYNLPVEKTVMEEIPVNLSQNNENSPILGEHFTKIPTLEMYDITVISESANGSKIIHRKEEVTHSHIYLETGNSDDVHYTLNKLQAMDEQIKSTKARILNVNEIN